MSRQVRWTNAALNEVDAILDYIARDDRVAAEKVANKIQSAALLLGKRAIGRRGRVTGTYEKSVTGLPYIVAYSIETHPDGSEALIILHVIHTARDWRPERWPME